MRDEVSQFPGRIRLVPVPGTTDVYDVVDESAPIVEGTPLNQAALLSEETARMYGVPNDPAFGTPTVNGAFARMLYNFEPVQTVATQAEAQAGTSTSVRAWTSQRVRQSLIPKGGTWIQELLRNTAGSYTWTIPDRYSGAPYEICYFVFGGGGGGAGGYSDAYGATGGGGGGSGACLWGIQTVSPGTTYNLVIGAAGTAGSAASQGGGGGTTTGFGLTALGGGGGHPMGLGGQGGSGGPAGGGGGGGVNSSGGQGGTLGNSGQSGVQSVLVAPPYPAGSSRGVPINNGGAVRYSWVGFPQFFSTTTLAASIGGLPGAGGTAAGGGGAYGDTATKNGSSGIMGGGGGGGQVNSTGGAGGVGFVLVLRRQIV